MRKKQLFFLSRILVILIAVLFFFQSSGSAGNISKGATAQELYLPLISKLYDYESVLLGVVYDIRDGTPVSGAEVCLDYGKEICRVSNKNGKYKLRRVPAGTHTLTVEHPNPEFEKFVEDEFKIHTNTTFDIYLRTALEEAQWRVVLTWDTPSSWPSKYLKNLELHLWLRDSNDYHIYEGNKEDCSKLNDFPYACYERDVESGPDSIVFADEDDDYTVGVLHYYDEYPGMVPIQDLNVRVQVYDDRGLKDEFHIKDVRGESGDFWYVFDLISGGIERQECLQQYDNQNETPPVPCPIYLSENDLPDKKSDLRTPIK